MGLKELTIFKYIVTGSGQDKGVIVLRLDKYLKLFAYYKAPHGCKTKHATAAEFRLTEKTAKASLDVNRGI